jgi:hypothetical protein
MVSGYTYRLINMQRFPQYRRISGGVHQFCGFNLNASVGLKETLPKSVTGFIFQNPRLKDEINCREHISVVDVKLPLQLWGQFYAFFFRWRLCW